MCYCNFQLVKSVIVPRRAASVHAVLRLGARVCRRTKGKEQFILHFSLHKMHNCVIRCIKQQNGCRLHSLSRVALLIPKCCIPSVTYCLLHMLIISEFKVNPRGNSFSVH